LNASFNFYFVHANVSSVNQTQFSAKFSFCLIQAVPDLNQHDLIHLLTFYIALVQPWLILIRTIMHSFWTHHLTFILFMLMSLV